ncbi:hypothetical protein VTI28DRAFT_5154 [Corynascus sepedonium]
MITIFLVLAASSLIADALATATIFRVTAAAVPASPPLKRIRFSEGNNILGRHASRYETASSPQVLVRPNDPYSPCSHPMLTRQLIQTINLCSDTPPSLPYTDTLKNKAIGPNQVVTPDNGIVSVSQARQAGLPFPISFYDSPGHAIASGLLVGVLGSCLLWVVGFMAKVYVVWTWRAVRGFSRRLRPVGVEI